MEGSFMLDFKASDFKKNTRFHMIKALSCNSSIKLVG